MAAVGDIAFLASESAKPVRRLLLSLLTCFVAMAANAAPVSPAAKTEIDGLIVRLEASVCEFNRNGSWYTAAEAKTHLLRKLKYLEDRGTEQTTEQFIDMAASDSSTSGQPYLVRCSNGLPSKVASGYARSCRTCAQPGGQRVRRRTAERDGHIQTGHHGQSALNRVQPQLEC
jgi:hypothetical protein